ncbi:MAG: PIG-L deacetylase family protein [Pirellula sp.]
MFFDLSGVRALVCIGAHPDDIEIGCGGTILSLLETNPEIRIDWVVVGCNGPRKQEAIEAFHGWCRNATNCSVHTFEFQDTLFPSQQVEIKRAIHAIAESSNPDIVFTHRLEDRHQDHRTLSELTWNAFRNHLILEYEIPKYEGDLGNPNVFIPLADKVAHKKIDLLTRFFPSQHGKPWFDAETFRALMHIRGVESKSASGYSEAFHARKIWLKCG